ncbi:MAG TPA: 5-carboxymethyl-2-hydroxymuconate isomerase [Alphaproteobacteria bacterium]|jgi:5-carboxymethyl-2-hydroxymuconate isomerase|nr:MAG: 5-carboxymethyl-2-hydroxymuconate isomerase [SAR116 cluster bacterium MED-G06]RPG89275.1 MAG: 5-carboxymethyl-2-hydroxymuconate Delta-isomerase [Candidatus Puniceispirillum sp. TMED245]HCV89176.1 5-carboxymethyl-2-hydroxymuconate isomerase [Alphaproteobacteria bacterium]|tara:strand:- start:889 stop:1293 length:405 start_codon:yes stop_codon:yes gene_type:complete
MAHLSFEYSANLEAHLDMQALSDVMRDAMHDSGVFPLGGIRVRGTRVDVCSVASGEAELGFIDMTLRMGQGRDESVRVQVTDDIYSAAESWLRDRVGDMPFALSLEVMEIDARFAEKRFNTLHGFLKAKDSAGG